MNLTSVMYTQMNSSNVRAQLDAMAAAKTRLLYICQPSDMTS